MRVASSIDLLVPTYDRCELLAGCLDSVVRAVKPEGIDWRVIVIDNNSRDDTRKVVQSFSERHGERVEYLFEQRQGRSAALNCGIEHSCAELIGMIDDDEQLDVNWFQVAIRTFADPETDYCGGPCLPLWRAIRPEWLPVGAWGGVLSADDPDLLPITPTKFDGDRFFLRGGNAIIRRSVLQEVGGYSLALGRKGSDLGSCEDHDMFDRLRNSGAVGIFEPRLIIYHLVPPERVTRKYFRYWVFRHARSLALLDRSRAQEVKYVGRVPRYLIGSAFRSIPALFLAGRVPARFSAELQWWNLAGYWYGAYVDSRRSS